MERPLTVIVADDQLATRESLVRILRDAGYRVVAAIDGQDCLDKVATERPDLIILDVVMPKVGGLEVCRTIKRQGTGFVPIMFVSGRSDPGSKVDGLRAGAEDYLAKPYDHEELRTRVETLLRIKHMVDDALRSRAARDVEDGGSQDRLTGLYNQRFLTQRLSEEFERAERYSEPLSIMAVDLDAFDDINSRYGRTAGDRLLEACARSLARACRDTDVVARAGGDEFVVMLPGTHFAGCVGVAEKVWRDIRGTIVEDGGFKITCEASVGVASYPSRDVTTPKDLLRFAHAALARAKAEGRGRICLYQYQGYLFQPHST